MSYGYTGKILHVDLTTEKIHIEHQEEWFYRMYGGGSALNMYYLLKEMKAGVDPLGPENVLCLSVGVTTGVSAPGMSRLVVSAKSPLTKLAGDSQSGGFFPAELKFAGYDAVILKGRANRPLYLSIIDGEVKLHEAGHLWGKDTGSVQDIILAEIGEPRARVLQCGIAGENHVLFSALISMCTRANGRNGMGAVMGSKNLKAVCVRGRKHPEVFETETVKQLAKQST
ncbi:MAG: aldehyde ferredoxin oxidoreductase N-terminal domain-containing protein, partial [Desulfocapsaceae bacterium]|nr:aldehyde ferredoxin oxidoreductase N-terminal domain-containing protein [Desulfocapsaceae bacterium]